MPCVFVSPRDQKFVAEIALFGLFFFSMLDVDDDYSKHIDVSRAEYVTTMPYGQLFKTIVF
jgi:hypothetical protein